MGDAVDDGQALVGRRWTRYGKDRLYVQTAGGDRVGWLDLVSGAATLDRPEMADAFERCVARYLQGAVQEGTAQSSSGAAPPVSLPEQRVPVEPEPWTDLALNRPGESVRRHAEELKQEMRQRSRIGTFVLRATDAKTDERAFRVGARGEEAVGPRLERLVKHGWRVLHSVPVGTGDADIDHVLIGRGGVYTINTKNHPGGKVWVGERAILVNGQRTDYLRNSRFEADRTRDILGRATGLDLPVRPVLVFLTGTLIPQVTIKQMPADVLVLDRLDIPGAFRHGPQRIDATRVEQVYEQARRDTTWR